MFNPELSYYEEGCYPFDVNNVNVVVSPDGSCRSTDAVPVCGVEVKCPFPGKSHATPVFYTLPKYYVTQVLSEMEVLNVEQLYFVCYSAESTTIQRVMFDTELWALIAEEIAKVYGRDTPKRPTKKSDSLKSLQERIDKFLDTNAHFILEVPSTKAVECLNDHIFSATPDVYCRKHETLVDNFPDIPDVLNTLQELLYNTDANVDRSYQLTRNKASEFLGFMISDQKVPTGGASFCAHSLRIEGL